MVEHHCPSWLLCVWVMLWDISTMTAIMVSPGFHNVGVWVGVILKDILKVGKCWRNTLLILFLILNLNIFMLISWKQITSMLYLTIEIHNLYNSEKSSCASIVLILTPHMRKSSKLGSIGDPSAVWILWIVFFCRSRCGIWILWWIWSLSERICSDVSKQSFHSWVMGNSFV